MKLILFLCSLSLLGFTGEVVKKKGNKIVFRLDKDSPREKGSTYVVERDGFEIAQVELLKTKENLAVARVSFGVADVGDMAKTKKVEEKVIVDEAQTKQSSVTKVIEREFPKEVEKTPQTGFGISLSGTNFREGDFELGKESSLFIRENSINMAGLRLSYRPAEVFEFGVEGSSGKGESKFCYQTRCNDLESTFLSAGINLKFFPIENFYFGVYGGIVKSTHQFKSLTEHEFELEGAMASAFAGAHFNLSQHFFIDLEARYQRINYSNNKENFFEKENEITGSIKTNATSGTLSVGAYF